MNTTTRTDSERLAFVVAHGINCAPLSSSPHDYREEIDQQMDAWDQRLAAISRGEVRPSQEPRRLADAQHPAGYRS